MCSKFYFHKIGNFNPTQFKIIGNDVKNILFPIILNFTF